MQLTNRRRPSFVSLPPARPSGIRIGTLSITDRPWSYPSGPGASGDGGDGSGEGDGDGGDGGDGGAGGEGDSKVTFTTEQQAELNRIIARETKKAAAKAKADAEQAASDAEAEQSRKAEQDAAAERGEFDKVRGELEAERDGFKAQAERALAILAPQVDERWGDLPEEVTELYEGEDDDALAKADHIHRHRKLIERLAPKEAEKGNGPRPKPAGGSGPEIKSLLTKRRAGFSN